MKWVLFLCLIVASWSTPNAAEFKKISEQGLAAQSIAIGNVIGLPDSPSGVLQSPLGIGTKTTASVFYSSGLDDQTISAYAINFCPDST